MNSLIESLNVCGAWFFDFAPAILWQSSLLISVVFGVDFILRLKIRPAVRYTLWFVVFLKLLIPPTLALPTSAAWWLRTRKEIAVALPQAQIMTVNYGAPVETFVPLTKPAIHFSAPPPSLSREAWILLSSLGVSALLGAWSIFRWRQIAGCVQETTAANGELRDLFAKTCQQAGVRKIVRLQLTGESMSPAVCGLFRPVVLLPQSLIERLDRNQLRAVLLHELIHLRRRDVWVNCAQTLLQIAYWWHPLLWFANARTRRLREEAVDDAVMFALSDEAEIYAPTLLEVAKLTLNRPLATLGLVGILESRNSLRHRIERLLNFTAPGRVGVSVMSVLGIAAFTALAVPMGEPPARPSAPDSISRSGDLIQFRAQVDPKVFIRNLKAHAGETMHAANDDWNDILVSILDGYGVDCTPPRNVTFNADTGEITTQNTLAALKIVDGVMKDLNLPPGMARMVWEGQTLTQSAIISTNARRDVLIEAQFYQMRPADFASLNLDSAASHHDRDLSPWWDLPADQLTNVAGRLKELGMDPLASPRVQISDGVTADFSIDDGTNKIELECIPAVAGNAIKLTALARTTGKYAPDGKPWPDIAGHTNCAIFSRVDITNGNAIILRAEHAGTMPKNELIVLLKAKILESRSKVQSPFLGDLPGVGRLFSTVSNVPHTYPTNHTAPSVAGDQAAILVQDGKSLYQLGKLDEAEIKLNQALAIRPDDQVALYYLGLIKQQQIRAKVDTQFSKPPNPYARTNVIHTNAARQKLFQQLKDITFDKTSFSHLPLSEVVRTLSEQTQRRAVDQQGINFILNRAKPAQPQAFDPATGQPITTPSTPADEDMDLGAVTISLVPGLNNVRLLDVLEAIVKSSDHPIKYSLLDYGIEFSFKGPETMGLHTRTFRVDPNTFYQSLQNVSTTKPGITSVSGSDGSQRNSRSSAPASPGGAATAGGNSGTAVVGVINKQTQVQLAVIDFFDTIGVNLVAPKSVFFNDRQGTLTVHATEADLDLIERAINTLNIPPAEVTVKVRFVEVNENDTHALGFSWYLENFVMNNKTLSAGSSTPAPPANNGRTPTSQPPTLVSVSSILTQPQFKVVLTALDHRDGATLLGEGAVTTLSGRQANFQVVDVNTNVNGIKATATNNTTTYSYQTTNLTFGSTLDVVPYITADGYTIQLTVTPKVTEFLGYEDPKDYLKYDKTLKAIHLPLPKTRVRQLTTSATVWDGQTLVLENFSDDSVVTGPNGAKLFQEPYLDKKKKRKLIVFITPTIIDPAGNRVHSSDYYDFPKTFYSPSW